MESDDFFNKLINMYLELRCKTDINYFRDLEVVILMKPPCFSKFMSKHYNEVFFDRDISDMYFIRLCGMKTPIIIDSTLPSTTEMMMITRQKYERIEKEKMMSRLRKIFD